MKLVLVRWNDSVAAGGWRLEREWRDWMKLGGMTQQSVGFLLEDSDECVVLAQSVQEKDDPNMDHLIQIPRGAVISVTQLRKVGCK